MQRGEAINGAGIGMIATGERLGGLGRGRAGFIHGVILRTD